MKRVLLTLCVFIILVSVANAARFYECVDKDGNKLITNTTPPPGAICESRGATPDLTLRERQQIESERASRVEQQIQAERASRGTGCEIVNFSQYEVSSGGGSIVGGHISGGWLTGASVVGHKATCVDLTIRNNDSVERTITGAGVVAVTKKGNSRSPKGFMTKIQPGGMYQGTACFGVYMSTITKVECKF